MNQPRSATVATRCMMDQLEPRQLLALTLPDGFVEEMVVTGLDTPTSMVVAPDGRLFVTEKGGSVRIVNTKGALRSKPFITLPVDVYAERGLDGIALDPNFQSNGHVYVYYTRKPASNPNQPANGALNRLSRFTVSDGNPNVADPASERVILDNIAATVGIHNGGGMQFGADGMLYLGVGDAGQSQNAQNLGNLNGKILRLNVGNLSNIVPTDNPFVGQSGRRGEIWAYGLRNPFTMAIKPGTNTVYANDVGQNTWEEVNHIKKGLNYGWPTHEGSTSASGFEDPIYQYNHDGGGAAITGGVFYNGNQFPAQYKGRYFFADYLKRFIRTIDSKGNVATFATDVTAALDLDVAPDGSLYYLSGFGGEYTHPDNSIFRIAYKGAGANRNPVANIRVRPLSGLTPLKVTFNAGKTADPDGDKLRYVWRFGDGKKAVGINAQHTYKKAGTYRGRFITIDRKGGRAEKTFRVIAGSTAPRVKILAPGKNAFYTAGATIKYSAQASDREDGKMGKKDYAWTFVFHHDEHTHPFIQRRNGRRGSFLIPRTGEVDPNQFYRATLIVKDNSGLTTTRTVDIKPRVADLTIRSNIPGVHLTLDGQQLKEGKPITSVVGMRRDLGAPAGFTSKGKTYVFDRWSNNKARNHSINTPRKDTVYTAIYRESTRARRSDPTVFSGRMIVPVVAGSAYSFGEDEALLRCESATDVALATAGPFRPYNPLMGLYNIDMTAALRRLADRRIEEAMREGKFENLEGAGRPLDLEPMPASEEARMTWWALRILRNNEFIPNEVRWRKALDHLRGNLHKLRDESRLAGLVSQINQLVHKINTLGTNALKAPVYAVDLEDERCRLRARFAEEIK